MVKLGRHLIQGPMGVITAALMVFGLFGCGVKALPTPPQTQPMAAVKDLQATIDRDAKAIVLAWTAADDNLGIDGYAVYSSRTDLSQSPCPGCPENYEKVGTLATGGQAIPAQPYRFSYPAAAGFRYVIRVRPYLESGAFGPASNSVQIAFDY